ncbi:type II toxin-antitoxin system RelE/ParE family toxin [uncultured Proteiniphilum sp.]|uniref:type II toxin-antitoxin system RelE family toxin n=1 Tax=uncultured Proteiniphilum sp. TaxID=497637 RepID=UPI0026250598|nr:type II toxin-antitoxin system RelE/ParE family toxin [uncultured Proteiniphilum sp.]
MYTVVIHKKAKKEIDKIPDVYAIKIAEAIYDLAENPRPDRCVKLTGSNNYYRIRVADYRIIYSIKDNILYIEIIKVAHRKESYKRR